jgi:hypothetical protein
MSQEQIRDFDRFWFRSRFPIIFLVASSLSLMVFIILSFAEREGLNGLLGFVMIWIAVTLDLWFWCGSNAIAILRYVKDRFRNAAGSLWSAADSFENMV